MYTTKSVFCSQSVGKRITISYVFFPNDNIPCVYSVNRFEKTYNTTADTSFSWWKTYPNVEGFFSGVAKATGRLFASFAGIFDGRPLMLWLSESKKNLHKYTYRLLRDQMARKHGREARIQFYRICLENNWKDFGQSVFKRDGQGMSGESQYRNTLKIPIKTHQRGLRPAIMYEHHWKGKFFNFFFPVHRKRAFFFVV